MRNLPNFDPWPPTLIKVVAASALLAVLIVIVVETGKPNRSAAPALLISASSVPGAPGTIFVKTEAIRPTPVPEPIPPVLVARQLPQRPIPLPRPRPAH
jgi:hypothetical protein